MGLDIAVMALDRLPGLAHGASQDALATTRVALTKLSDPALGPVSTRDLDTASSTLNGVSQALRGAIDTDLAPRAKELDRRVDELAGTHDALQGQVMLDPAREPEVVAALKQRAPHLQDDALSVDTPNWLTLLRSGKLTARAASTLGHRVANFGFPQWPLPIGFHADDLLLDTGRTTDRKAAEQTATAAGRAYVAAHPGTAAILTHHDYDDGSTAYAAYVSNTPIYPDVATAKRSMFNRDPKPVFTPPTITSARWSHLSIVRSDGEVVGPDTFGFGDAEPLDLDPLTEQDALDGGLGTRYVSAADRARVDAAAAHADVDTANGMLGVSVNGIRAVTSARLGIGRYADALATPGDGDPEAWSIATLARSGASPVTISPSSQLGGIAKPLPGYTVPETIYWAETNDRLPTPIGVLVDHDGIPHIAAVDAPSDATSTESSLGDQHPDLRALVDRDQVTYRQVGDAAWPSLPSNANDVWAMRYENELFGTRLYRDERYSTTAGALSGSPQAAVLPRDASFESALKTATRLRPARRRPVLVARIGSHDDGRWVVADIDSPTFNEYTVFDRSVGPHIDAGLHPQVYAFVDHNSPFVLRQPKQ